MRGRTHSSFLLIHRSSSFSGKRKKSSSIAQRDVSVSGRRGSGGGGDGGGGVRGGGDWCVWRFVKS